MRLPILLLSVISSCQVIVTAASSAVCPQLGSYQNSSCTAYSPRAGLYLSRDSPSQCQGKVTQWNFCYQRDFPSSATYGVKFMVYRLNASTSVYYRVSNSLTTYMSNNLAQENCLSIPLSQNESFDIQTNDIAAACMIDDVNTNPLRLSCNSRNVALRIREIMGSPNYDDCTEDQLLSLDIPTLRSDTDNFLLLEAVISSTRQVRAGYNPTRSFSSAVFGIFVNHAFPAETNGYITSWNYCYYTDTVSTSQTYTAVFAAWRYDNQSTFANLSVVNNSATTISLQHEYTIATIYCKVVELEPEKYFPIMKGDLVGVTLPLTNAIPLIGSTSEYFILVHSISQETTTLPLNSFAEFQVALHLYVDIDTSMQENGGNTDSQTTRLQPTQALSSTTEASMTQVRGTSGGLVAAIVIIILVIAAAGVAGVLIIALIVQRKFKTSRKTIAISQDQTVPQSFDNINYAGYRDNIHDLQPYVITPVTSGKKEIATQSDPYEPVIDPPVRPRAVSILEASNVYASINLHGDDVHSTIMEESISQNVYAEVEHELYQTPHTEEEHLYSQIYAESRAENIDRKTIKVVRHLGSGQFGSVDEGIWFNGSEEVKVALKRLRDDASSSDKVKFLQEPVIMAQFNHENVIRLLGMVLEGNPIILIMEFASRGDLRENLLDVRNEHADRSLPKLLLYFSRQVACGMLYLSSRHFVHRDLAARNILLSENCICKIADFGLSRDLEDDNYYKSSGGLVPVKWTAPEAINYRKYSTASDVWSYGCVLYEIWSLGHKPFEKHQNFELVDILKKGTRLPPPSGCPRAVYATMIKCWHPYASKRPSFRDLVLTLTKPDDIMEIPGSVVTANPDFQTPGGDLNVGIDVYKDLQMTYT